MPPYLDIYVLAPSRSAALARRFLNRYLAHREPAADEYDLPQHAEAPEAVFSSAEERLAALEKRPTEPHALYWRSTVSGPVRHAMVCPTSDGSMALGLSVEEDQEEMARQLLGDMRQFVGTPFPGFIGWEEPAPTSTAAFLKRAEASQNEA